MLNIKQIWNHTFDLIVLQKDIWNGSFLSTDKSLRLLDTANDDVKHFM